LSNNCATAASDENPPLDSRAQREQREIDRGECQRDRGRGGRHGQAMPWNQEQQQPAGHRQQVAGGKDAFGRHRGVRDVRARLQHEQRSLGLVHALGGGVIQPAEQRRHVRRGIDAQKIVVLPFVEVGVKIRSDVAGFITGDQLLVLASLAVVAVWKGFGYSMLILIVPSGPAGCPLM
jgi:hypothetical protein